MSEIEESERPVALVVDDEPLIGKALALLLGEHYEILVAHSVLEAQELLSAELEVAFVLCDILMPTQSGVALWSWAESERPELAGRFIFMSGDDRAVDRHRPVAPVGTNFIEKPFELTELQRAIARARGRSGIMPATRPSADERSG